MARRLGKDARKGISLPLFSASSSPNIGSFCSAFDLAWIGPCAQEKLALRWTHGRSPVHLSPVAAVSSAGLAMWTGLLKMIAARLCLTFQKLAGLIPSRVTAKHELP
jgi:hypothetical protein